MLVPAITTWDPLWDTAKLPVGASFLKGWAKYPFFGYSPSDSADAGSANCKSKTLVSCCPAQPVNPEIAGDVDKLPAGLWTAVVDYSRRNTKLNCNPASKMCLYKC